MKNHHQRGGSGGDLVYVLQLTHGKYYVGKTNNLSERWKEHQQGMGSAWTNKFQPIKIVKIYKNCKSDDENKITWSYMRKYGPENVRGGAFVSMELPSDPMEIMGRMTLHDDNRCFICGKVGHYASECWERDDDEYDDDDDDSNDMTTYSSFTDARGHTTAQYYSATTKKTYSVSYSGNNLFDARNLATHDDATTTSSSSSSSSSSSRNLSEIRCYRCNRIGHYASNCFQKTAPSVTCYKCGQSGHIAPDCSLRKDVVCYKCGKAGHYANACFSKFKSTETNKNGGYYPRKR